MSMKAFNSLKIRGSYVNELQIEQSKKIRMTLFKTPQSLTRETIESEDLKTEEYDLQFNKLRLFTIFIKPTYILAVKDTKAFKISTYLTNYRKMVKEGIVPFEKGENVYHFRMIFDEGNLDIIAHDFSLSLVHEYPMKFD